MTAKGYIGSDFDFLALVDAERRAETAVALDAMLSNGALGGKLGDRIRSGNFAFRGRAGDQVRRDYLDFVLRETDLTVHSCEYVACTRARDLLILPDLVGAASSSWVRHKDGGSSV